MCVYVYNVVLSWLIDFFSLLGFHVILIIVMRKLGTISGAGALSRHGAAPASVLEDS